MPGLNRIPLGRPPAARSLRRSLVLYLVTACLLPLVLICIITYFTIYSILQNKIQIGINASLKQEAAALENMINNLDFASKQFALDGQIVGEVSAFLQEGQVYRKMSIMSDINDKITLVNFTNPYLGITAYVMPEEPDPVLFTNFNIGSEFTVDGLPAFMRYNGATYFGPHRTKYRQSENIVFSSLRAVQTTGQQKVYVYLESNYNLFRKILNQQSYGIKLSHLLVNEAGQVTYVENPDTPAPASLAEVKWNDASQVSADYRNYLMFRYESVQGWQLIAAVKKSSFNSEIRVWFLRIGVLAVATLLFALLIALSIWKKVYGPLRKVNRQIVRMAENLEAPVSYTNVQEFDFLLGNFQDMKDRISELFAAVEHNEKQKSQLEVEKLLSQINPHFLHNTLNTVQWLARMNGQKEIDRLVTLLVKVLHYNLGKQSIIVTMREEIEALQNYMELQRIRYDYEFEFDVKAEDGVLNAAIPRFLLQPLVENAIYHGASEANGRIEVTIRSAGAESDMILMQVKDNGPGLAEREAMSLLQEEEPSKRRGLGIGLSYVNRLLHRFYGDAALLDIQSRPGSGTAVTIQFPSKMKEELEE
ncbi:sensor histidine kinase [Paenibacillus pinistramenti]|uniref:sensor histidine kinase n=1 Tax=Paenibacillus pinistramenti TaxID=1768003 RepID=UPI001109B030|nr:histidine kinase [Paenibacillus pinistramenti]